MGSWKKSKSSKIVTILIRIALGTVFIYASLDKIADPAGFAVIVENYQLLPSLLVPATAILLPWIEAICGVALVFGRFEKGAAMLTSLLMVVFIGVTLYNGYRGLDIACGCFTLSAKESSNVALNTLRNLVLLAACGWVMFNAKRWQSESVERCHTDSGG